MLLLTLALGCADSATLPIRPPATDMAEMPGHGEASDQMFIDMMVPHHEGAVAMAEIAQDRADHGEIKAMAGRVIVSQGAEIAAMKGWRKAWFGSEDPAAMDRPMKHADMAEMDRMPGMGSARDMESDLEALRTSDRFDLAFLDAMVPHHEAAVAMAARCAEKAEHSEIKALARTIVESQRAEIAQMRRWRTEWYPSAPAPAIATD